MQLNKHAMVLGKKIRCGTWSGNKEIKRWESYIFLGWFFHTLIDSITYDGFVSF